MATIGEFYRQQFPYGVRMEMWNPDSLVYACDEARIKAFEWFDSTILEMGNQFQIRTATTALDDYEDWLLIPRDDTLSVDERRVRIMIKFAGYPATIKNIKRLAKEITGIDIVIHEYGLPSDSHYDPTKCWKVKIIVDYNIPGIKPFKRSYFETLMKDLFPAHTEWESDSFLYIAPHSYLAPVSPESRRVLVLDEEYLQYQ